METEIKVAKMDQCKSGALRSSREVSYIKYYVISLKSIKLVRKDFLSVFQILL